MARPRTVTDADALARARGCIVEHGPGVSLATLARAIGLSPPALLKRFGSKEHLLFRALLPSRPPRWLGILKKPPGPHPEATLRDVLLELRQEFSEVGPALAALRMSRLEVSAVFPADVPGPPVLARELLAAWLHRAGVPDGPTVADAAVGAAEARGFLSWVGPQLVGSVTDEEWADKLARSALRTSSSQ